MSRNKLSAFMMYLALSPVLMQLSSLGHAQSARSTAAALEQNAKDDNQMKEAGQKGLPMTVDSNVADAADVQAVLIPSSLASKIFGKEVAKNYAVVEVIVSNKDPKAAMVVQSLFLDYSDWALSGHLPGSLTTRENQRANQPSQVASIESRLVRGELLDAQQWTPRNWTVRSLTFLGTAGVAFAFPFSTDVIKGIGAFNGAVVPGAAALWPDGTTPQINRISDFGFQTNKLVAKQSAELIVAFFPIDRFLLGSFKKDFLKRPAAWFVPYELMVDKTTRDEFVAIVKPIYEEMKGGTPIQDKEFLIDAMAAMHAEKCTDDTRKAIPKTCSDDSYVVALHDLLAGVSLNNIRVVVQGVMTVDVAAVPATVYDVAFDDDSAEKAWSTPSDYTGSISGLYLTGGDPEIVDDKGKKLPDATVEIVSVSKGSTDTNLNFKLTLKGCIQAPKRLFLVVNKSSGKDASADSRSSAKSKQKSSSGNSLQSMPYEFANQPATNCTADGHKAADGASATPAAGTTNTSSEPSTGPTKKAKP